MVLDTGVALLLGELEEKESLTRAEPEMRAAENDLSEDDPEELVNELQARGLDLEPVESGQEELDAALRASPEPPRLTPALPERDRTL